MKNYNKCHCETNKHISKCLTTLVNIGYTNNLEQTHFNLKKNNPNIYIHKYIEGNKWGKLKKSLNKFFKNRHYRLNWYYITNDEIDKLVDSIK